MYDSDLLLKINIFYNLNETHVGKVSTHTHSVPKALWRNRILPDTYPWMIFNRYPYWYHGYPYTSTQTHNSARLRQHLHLLKLLVLLSLKANFEQFRELEKQTKDFNRHKLTHHCIIPATSDLCSPIRPVTSLNLSQSSHKMHIHNGW